MGTHRITINIPDETYVALHKRVDSGEFESLEMAISVALESLRDEAQPGFQAGNSAFGRWLEQDVLPAHEEAIAHPDRLMTPDRVLSYLSRQRTARRASECLTR